MWIWGALEMVLQLKVFAVLPLSSVPNTHIRSSKPPTTPALEDPTPLAFIGTCTHRHTPTCRHAHTHMRKIKGSLKKSEDQG